MAEEATSQGVFVGGLALALMALSVLAVVAVLVATGMGA
jgi:hypothetical protein